MNKGWEWGLLMLQRLEVKGVILVLYKTEEAKSSFRNIHFQSASDMKVLTKM